MRRKIEFKTINRTVVFLLFIFALNNIRVTAQIKTIDFPTPNAAELGKYGQIPVDFFTGLPQIGIPLYNFKYREIEVPIRLSYHAAGNKVEDYPGWVGLGWHLSSGGSITRVVNGMRDEISRQQVLDEKGSLPSGEVGYFYRCEDLNTANWSTESFLTQLVGADLNYSMEDTSPDEFIFNFGGMSGSFFFVREGGQLNVKIKSKQGITFKVSPVLSSDVINFKVFDACAVPQQHRPSVTIQNMFLKFIVTASNGVKYVFGGDASAIDFTSTQGRSATSGVTIPTTWHLTEVISPNGYKISLEYRKEGDIIVKKKSKQISCIYTSDAQGNPVTGTGGCV